MFKRFFMESKEKYDAVDFSPTAKLPRLDMHLNAAGASIACLLPFNIFGYFLLFYYTDVIGMSPAMAGSLTLFARVFDTFTDVAMGYFIDRFNFRPGKYRFWVLVSIPAQFVMLHAVFFIIPGVSLQTQIIWCWVTYALYGSCCATLGYIPQNCQTQNMTRNDSERAKAASLKGVYENISILAAAALFLPCTEKLTASFGNKTAGWLVTVFIFACFSFIWPLLSARTTRKYELTYEGEYRPELLVESKRESISVWANLRMFFTSRAACLTTFGVALMFALQTARNSMIVYLFEYYFVLPEMTSISLALNCGLAIIGSLSVPYLIKFFKDTARAFETMAIVHVVMYMILYFWIKASSLEAVQASFKFGPMFFLYCFCGLFQGMYYAFPMAIMPAAVDHCSYKHGRNMSGFVYGFYGVMLTCGGAIGSFIAGKMLDSTGYVAHAAQSAHTLSSMLFCGFVVPAIFAVIHCLMQVGAGISDKKHAEWVKAIDERLMRESAEKKLEN